MNNIQLNPHMKVAELNRIAIAHGLRVKLMMIEGHADSAMTAVDRGDHTAAIEHIREASARVDELLCITEKQKDTTPCAA